MLPAIPSFIGHRRRWTALAVAASALAIGYFAWFRDSSLVAVNHVSLEGLSGGSQNPAAAALTRAAKRMTTLDIDDAALDAATARFPAIASVSATAHFPHGMTIAVTERAPVLLVKADGRSVPAARDGTLLPGATTDGKFPSVAVDRIPSSGRLSGVAHAEAHVIGAAPAPLRREVQAVAYSPSSGVRVTMPNGIELRFGPATSVRAKWDAAAAVLADRRLAAAQFVDLRVPRRPAVG